VPRAHAPLVNRFSVTLAAVAEEKAMPDSSVLKEEAPAKSGGELSLDKHLMMAFATPVVSYPWPDSEALNRELAAVILAAERKDDGITRSNVGGWHSTTDFFEWKEAPIKALGERVRQMTMAITRAIAVAKDGPRNFNYRIDGWANVSRHGNYNSAHNHPNCLWSGVYYVATGTPDPESQMNGRLELLDPRAGVNMMYIADTLLHARYLITPTPGLMILFPSWLSHLVHPFFGTGERISIAFNILTTEAKKA
jgi:uncharacterized protein (TIGR02466 family)